MHVVKLSGCWTRIWPLSNSSRLERMSNVNKKASSSFTTRRINQSTFVVREDDLYKEHPLIYVKIHPKVPLIVLSDTGCNEPSEKHKQGRSECKVLLVIDTLWCRRHWRAPSLQTAVSACLSATNMHDGMARRDQEPEIAFILWD